MLDLLDRTPEELSAPRNVFITGRWNGNAESEQIGGIEAGIQCFESHQTPKQQHGAGEKNNGYGNLCPYQPGPQAPAGAQTGTAITAQSANKIRARCNERRRQSEKYAG